MGDIVQRYERDYPLLMPDVSAGQKLVLASDYGGQHDLATHKSYAFLLADVDHSQEWERARDRFRRERLSDGRRISYEALRDRIQRDALPEFLAAADRIVGVVATFLVDRQLETLLTGTVKEGIAAALPAELPSPPAAVLEDMIRVAHFITLLLGGLSREGQGVQWITDQDAIVENGTRQRQMNAVLNAVSGAYELPRLSYFRAGSTASPDPTRIVEDLASIPDLTAGALAAVLEERPEILIGLRAGLIVPRAENIPDKANRLLGWLAWERAPLKRWTFVLSPSARPDNDAWVALLRLHDADDPI
jgi:hypothetical protein